MSDDKKTDIEVGSKANPKDISTLADTMKDILQFAKGLEDTKKTISEQKVEIDKAKADVATLLETIDRERKGASAAAAKIDASVTDIGIGYKASDILTTAETKSMEFKDLLLAPTNNEQLKSMQARASDVFLVGHLIAARKGVPLSSVFPELKLYQNFMKDTEEIRTKAMSIGSGEAGFEWIPTGFSADLIDIFHLQLKVAALHPGFTIPARMTSWKVPGTSSDLQAFRTTAAATDTPTKFRASTRSTRQVTFTPEKLTAATLFDIELEEDSIIPVLPNLKMNIAEALMRAVEDTIINGDTAGTMDNTDMHGRTIDNESPTKMWDGYRKFITNHGSVRQNAGGAATFGGMIQVQRSMGKYGINPGDLAWVTSPNGYFDTFLKLAKVQTIDLFGPQAVIKTGQLASFMGVPVIVSEQERQDLKTTTGVSGGASSGYNDTSCQLVWTKGHSLGTKREITVDAARIPRTDTIEVWSTMRADFQAGYTTGEAIIAEITNVA